MGDLWGVINPEILLWLVLMIVFVVAELVTVGLVSIWFAAGALAALLVAIFGGNIWIQIILFAVVSIVLLFATRPLARKFFNSRLVRTNADTLIGEKVRITERVSNADQTGAAVANGQEWTVRANNDKDIFEVGEPAQVTRIEGVKLIVDKIKEDS